MIGQPCPRPVLTSPRSFQGTRVDSPDPLQSNSVARADPSPRGGLNRATKRLKGELTMTNPRSTPRNTHWMAVAGLAIAGLAMNVGCSSGGSTPADSGAGGHDSGTGTGGKVDSGTDA